MPKRTLAALCALLVAASALAAVAGPAAAHSKTETVKRCAYDPFAGNQCWTETVSVSHTHSCPSGTTGAYPNCHPIPPANQQNKGDEEAKKAAEEARKKAEEEAKRKADEEAKRKAAEEAERKRKEVEEARKVAEEAERKRKEAEKDGDGAGTKGTRPNRPTQTECPKMLGTHPHLDRDQHNHKLMSGAMTGCHDASDGHRHSDGTRHSSGTVDLDKDTAPGQECPTNYVYNGSACELKEGLKIVRRGAKLVWEGTGEVLCTLTGGGIASKVVNGIVKNLPKAAKWFAEKGVEQIIEHPCDQAWEELQEFSTSQVFDPEIVPPVPNDPADDDSDPPNTPAEWDQAVKEAEEKWQRGDGGIDGDELTRMQNERDCAYGHPWAQNCE